MTIRTNNFSWRRWYGLITLLLVSSCDVYKMENCPSYVVCYVNLESIVLTAEPSNPQCLLIKHGNDLPITAYWLHSTGPDKERYEQLCKKHNDLTYNRYRSLSHIPYESVTYNACDFTDINITTDKDFDQNHPAGTDLADIVRFMSWSPNKYILSGYKQYYHYKKSDVSEIFDKIMRIYINKDHFDYTTDMTCYPIDKLTEDLNVEDLVLLGDDSPGLLGILYFENIPQEKGEYTITVTIRTDNDKNLVNSVKMTF